MTYPNDSRARLRHPNRTGQRQSVALSLAGLDARTQLLVVRRSIGRTPAQLAATQKEPWSWRAFGQGDGR